jgi:hypothetical protein
MTGDLQIESIWETPTAISQKPVIFGECGIGDPIMACDYTGWYKDLFASPFTGLASTGMSWDESRSFGHWQEYGKLKYFLENYFLNEVDLEQDLWLPGYAEMENENEHYAESIYLQYVEPNHNRFIGVIFNRSWNFKTINDNFGVYIDPIYSSNTEKNFLENQQPLDVAYGPNNEMRIKLDSFSLADLGDEYRIEYFDPDNLNYEGICNGSTEVGPVHCETAHVSLDGLDIKQFPTLTFATRPILFFRAFRNNGEDVFSTKSLSQSNNSGTQIGIGLNSITTVMDEYSENQQQDIIYPNPANDLLSVQSETQGSYRVYNEYGMLIIEGTINKGMNPVNISQLASGFYFISFGNRHKKFIKAS